MKNCYCDSGLPFEQCCKPIIENIKKPTTIVELLRARYSSHVICNVDFIISSIHPEKIEEHDATVIKKWADEAQWEGLKILRIEKGEENDDEGVIEFIANYREKNKPIKHHEIASFKKKDDSWYFYDSTIPFVQVKNDSPKIGRNDPCVCGSGKKYKKCCGA